VLAAISGLLILISAATGLAQMPRLRWITIPPLVAVLLLLVVSYFGAQVVLRGLAPGWAAVDVGSALMVVALMVTAAVIAFHRDHHPGLADRLTFSSPFSKLVLATVTIVYILFVSGLLIAGKGSLSACLGWPIYSPSLFQLDVHTVTKTLRLVLSVVGIGFVVAVLVQAWRSREEQPGVYRMARWVGLAFILEALLQILGLAFGMPIGLMIAYTIVAAAFWALLVALLVTTGLETKLI
jgi:heme A synthase